MRVNGGTGQEVWRGGVNAWECDENGHMNTRFHVMRAVEGMRTLFALHELPSLFSPSSATTVVPREMHIRFHREARGATVLSTSGGVTAVREDEADVVLVTSDIETGAPTATFRVRAAHVRADDPAQTEPWPERFQRAAREWVVDTPEIALPRSTGDSAWESTASAERAAELGLQRISLGSLEADRVDAFGRMVPQGFIGAVSDGIRGLTTAYRDIVVRHSGEQHARTGGAVLEFRVLHTAWPRIGDSYEVVAGLAGVTDKVKSIICWMLDPVSGRVYGSMQSIAVDFDLDTRKMIRPSPEALAELQKHVVPGFAP